MQPVIDTVRNQCMKIERTKGNYSVDEQMIPFSGKCIMKQYVRNKPRPVGLKNFVITDSDGLMFDFIIYQGEKTNLPDRNLGLGPAVILKLSETIPKKSSLYFDRYFTSIPLLVQLRANGLNGTGTIMSNRFPKSKEMKTDRAMKRGDNCQINAYMDEGKKPVLGVTKWMDNKSVIMVSTEHGIAPQTEVVRWVKKDKRFQEFPCPSVVSQYNQNMGGVDNLDQMIEYYRCFFKTRKWPVKVIIHFFDLAIVNAHKEYRRAAKISQVPASQVKDLLHFRIAIAQDLRISTPLPPVPMESDSENEETARAVHRNRPLPMPSALKRYDRFDHWPIVADITAPLRCRMEGCVSRSKVMCTKCKVYLCLTKNKNCFLQFHIP